MSIEKSLIINILEIIAIIGCLSIIPLSMITGRYFDKLLDAKKLPKPLGYGILPYGVMNRVIDYMYYILYNEVKITKSGKYKDPYLEKIRDFNFRAHARPME